MLFLLFPRHGIIPKLLCRGNRVVESPPGGLSRVRVALLRDRLAGRAHRARRPTFAARLAPLRQLHLHLEEPVRGVGGRLPRHAH